MDKTRLWNKMQFKMGLLLAICVICASVFIALPTVLISFFAFGKTPEAQGGIFSVIIIICLAVVICVLFLALFFGLKMFNRLTERYLRTLAYTDHLTKLKNRNSFEQDMNDTEKNIKKYTSIILLILDLNNLKDVNDSIGHTYGDQYLRTMASLIHDCFSAHGEVYRIGGDEFAVFARNSNIKQIRDCLLKLETSTGNYNAAMTKYTFSVAVGIAEYDPDEDADLRSVFNRADENMYKDKIIKKNH